MLQIKNLRVIIQNLTILRDISFSVPEGSIVALVGRNGAGKTTTLRSIMGLTKAASGSIKLNETDLLRIPTHRRVLQGIGYMPEDRRIISAITAEENILLPTWTARFGDVKERLARIYELMPEVQALANRSGSQLSGGQQKLVALARAMMAGRRVLLVDEPFEGVAPALVERMCEVIRSFQKNSISILIASSEYQQVERWADDVYVIERGAIMEM
ncbi:MAG: ATP-binding cassette domain-containing protein [Bacillota bacterium]